MCFEKTEFRSSHTVVYSGPGSPKQKFRMQKAAAAGTLSAAAA